MTVRQRLNGAFDLARVGVHARAYPPPLPVNVELGFFGVITDQVELLLACWEADGFERSCDRFGCARGCRSSGLSRADVNGKESEQIRQ